MLFHSSSIKKRSDLWCDVFANTWNSPPSYTSEHRPGIARVEGARIILDGTTIEEVKSAHKATLELCVAEANKRTAARIEEIKREKQREEAQREERAAIRSNAQEQAKDIKFD